QRGAHAMSGARRRVLVQPLFRFLLLVATVGLLTGGLVQPSQVARAKEVDVVGTVDCGQRSGRRCDVRELLSLWTDSLSGRPERATIDVSWIRATLPALDQDDEITVLVEVHADGVLQALNLVSDAPRSGSVNPGASTGSREVTEARHDRGAAQD